MNKIFPNLQHVSVDGPFFVQGKKNFETYWLNGEENA